ncbi:MAG: DNA polymerase III subunit delta', partial [Microcystis sp.]
MRRNPDKIGTAIASHGREKMINWSRLIGQNQAIELLQRALE